MTCGLIGKHLSHSYSKEIHRMIADYDYELLEMDDTGLGDFLKKKKFSGVNITIPYKQTVMKYLDVISENARNIGAVNTVVNNNGELFGFNTDTNGMRELVSHSGIEIKGKKVLILGTGGTSKTAYRVMEYLGARDIICVSRCRKNGSVTYELAKHIHRDAQVIMNTTPVGMYPDLNGMPIDLSGFTKLEGVLDAVYNPIRTNLVLSAEKSGIIAEGGLYMLCAQAVHASALFLNKTVDRSLIDNVFKKIKNEKENIVLIGMPTCGKSTVGRIVSRVTGKSFYDTDELVESNVGEKPQDYILKYGEEAFRQREKEVVEKFCKNNGCVISTGGGTVVEPENVRMLKNNGRLVFLDRPLCKLIASPDRPLSSDFQKLTNLFEERYRLYKENADICVNADMPPEAVAKNILTEIGYENFNS